MISQDLLSILCCPETHQPVFFAESELITKLNEQVSAGQVRNRGGELIHEKLEAGLVREDRQLLYPVRQDIPVMLVDQAIPLQP